MIKKALIAATAAGVAFQIGHFAEHAYQFGHWVLVDRTKPWMSGAADWLVRSIGVIADCGSKLGMELLHLGGNSIFLATIAGLLILKVGERKNMWRAFNVELFHLTEHIMLVLSVAAIGRPMGWSTLFGLAPEWFGANAAVGYRVGWHFFLNLIPTALMMVALMPRFMRKSGCQTCTT